jgi:hypothetical protein
LIFVYDDFFLSFFYCPGAGYTNSGVVFFAGGTGSQAAAEYRVCPTTGQILSIMVTNPGYGNDVMFFESRIVNLLRKPIAFTPEEFPFLRRCFSCILISFVLHFCPQTFS